MIEVAILATSCNNGFVDNTLGARIAKLREARGLTGEQLGLALGRSKSQISKIENGTRRLDVSEIALMADALGVTLGELLGTSQSRSLAIASRVIAQPTSGADAAARRRLRQLLEADTVLTDSYGLRPGSPSAAGAALLKRIGDAGLHRPGGSAPVVGEHLADVVRECLGLGRAPVADIAELAERHLGVDVAIWPVGEAVSGLCVHGQGVAMLLVSSSCSAGHERFTAAHELAHHLLGDPREVVIEGNVYDTSTPTEMRANAFAAAFLLPKEGVLELIGGRSVDANVLGEVLRHFRVSYQALVWRLVSIRVLNTSTAKQWLKESASAVLRAAGHSNPGELTEPTLARRIPTRLWRAALDGYQTGRVGLGVLAALSDEETEVLYGELAGVGIVPPAVADDLVDV